MRKRGSIQDVFYIMLVLFILGVFSIIGYMVYSNMNTKLQTLDIQKQMPDGSFVADTAAKGIWSDTQSNYVGWFDGLFLTIMILLWVVSLVMAWQVDSNPVMYFLSIFIYIVLIIISAVIANSYYEIAGAVGIAQYADDFRIIPFVMQYFAHIMLFIGFSIGIVMWGKSQGASY